MKFKDWEIVNNKCVEYDPFFSNINFSLFVIFNIYFFIFIRITYNFEIFI